MKFGYTVIYVESVTQSLALYEAAFGFKTRFLHDSNMYGELETGETTLAFAVHEMGDMNLDGEYLKTSLKNQPFGIELAFVTHDIEAAFEQAIKAGCIALKPPVEKPWGQTVGYVRTPDGTLIELCTPVAA